MVGWRWRHRFASGEVLRWLPSGVLPWQSQRARRSWSLPHASSSRDDAELQLQLANLLFEETRFAEALEAYRKAVEPTDGSLALTARIGFVRTALRIGQFQEAQREAASLRGRWRRATPKRCPRTPTPSGRPGCSTKPKRAGAMRWRSPRSRRARATGWRARWPRNRSSRTRMIEAQAALKPSPRDGELHHTVGAIYERMRRYEQAAAAYNNYINLLPNKDRSDKAAWSRSQVRFLKSFGEKEPHSHRRGGRRDVCTPWTSASSTTRSSSRPRVNGGRWQDFVLDTGSEQTTISRQTASSANVRPITYTLSAGVGEVGLRGLQLGRIDTFEIGTLKLENVPVLIKAPALRGIPKRETESFSPLALGLSMTIDYATRKLTIGHNAAGRERRVQPARCGIIAWRWCAA